MTVYTKNRYCAYHYNMQNYGMSHPYLVFTITIKYIINKYYYY